MRGDVTVGMGPEALLCVADRDAATGEIIPGSFSQRIPLKAANLMPGGAEAARACAVSLKNHQTNRAQHQDQNHSPQPQFLRVYPSGVFTGDRSALGRNARAAGDTGGSRTPQAKSTRFPGVATSSDDEGGGSNIPSSTVRVTFPAAALHGCFLRCRANGRTVPVSIVSAFKSVSTLSDSSPPHKATSVEATTLVVNIEASGIDGVAMLELARSDRSAEDVLGNKCGDASHSPHHDRMSGVPAGLPAMPVLLVSDPEVYASLAEILALNENEQSTFGRHASTLYALGATMRGKAPPRQVFQSACWAASKGKIGLALMLRLFELYPAASIITSVDDAATLLLHATASGDLRTVHTALYHGREAAEALGFDGDELAQIPTGASGETPLHRAAALHERGGDADVMCELLATLSKPLAWSMSSPGRKPQLMGSLLLVEAVGAATATLVRVARRYPPSASDGNTLASFEIIQEAISVSPFPSSFTPRESARAAITLELLRSPRSSMLLLNVAAFFNAESSNRRISGAGGVFHAPGLEASPLSSSSLFPTETVECEFIAEALQRWPTLGCNSTMEARSSDFIHRVFREGAAKSLKQFGKVMSWLVKYSPNGDGSLFFDTDPKLERTWMVYRARIQWTVDHAAFTFLVFFMLVALIRFHIAPSLQSDSSMRFDWRLLVMLLSNASFVFMFHKFPGWYSRHREAILFLYRITSPLSPIHKIFAFHAVSPFRQNVQLVLLNLYTACYPIRADRHLFIQIMNTVTQCLLGGYTYTWATLPLRSSLAAASFVVTLMQEVHSRRAFALEHQRAMAAQQSRSTKGRSDRFKWGVIGDDVVKPGTRDPDGKHEHTDAVNAKHD